MSGKLIDLRRRIKTIGSTKKITRAMKSVSGAKLRKSVTAINNNTPYFEELKDVINGIAAKIDREKNEFIKIRDKGKVLVIVISGDKGLCGAFNTNMARDFEKYSRKLKEEGEELLIIAIGKKISDYLVRHNIEINKSYPDTISNLDFKNSQKVSEYIQKLYLAQEIKYTVFFYHGYLSASQQKIDSVKVFPLDLQLKQPADEEEYILEPSAQELFELILPEYIESYIFSILLESYASEQTARMIAMDSATKNATDMIKRLTLIMNKLRQESITNELLEIITATEAMNY